MKVKTIGFVVKHHHPGAKSLALQLGQDLARRGYGVFFSTESQECAAALVYALSTRETRKTDPKNKGVKLGHHMMANTTVFKETARKVVADMAREARLSRYHFLRVFQRITGLTPHRYLLRARLRRVATRLLVEGTAVLDIALDSGFGDISNFNHAFRAEFGVSPRIYRKIVPGVGVEPTRRVSVRGF